MAQVKVRALIPNTDAVFTRISDFERCSHYTDAVREITFRRLGNLGENAVLFSAEAAPSASPRSV